MEGCPKPSIAILRTQHFHCGQQNARGKQGPRPARACKVKGCRHPQASGSGGLGSSHPGGSAGGRGVPEGL